MNTVGSIASSQQRGYLVNYSDPTRIKARLEAKYEPVTESGCWLFTGACNQDGYGVFEATINGKKHVRAHRASYALHKGDIPEGQSVLHKCDVPGCVNPEHMFLGTQGENVADCCSKGRQARGTKKADNILTEGQVREIHAMKGTCREIGSLYGVAARTVNNIKRGVKWKHLGLGKNMNGKASGDRNKVPRKLSSNDVRQIFESAIPGYRLAAAYGVSRSTISAIKLRKTWAWVTN